MKPLTHHTGRIRKLLAEMEEDRSPHNVLRCVVQIWTSLRRITAKHTIPKKEKKK